MDEQAQDEQLHPGLWWLPTAALVGTVLAVLGITALCLLV